MTVRARRYLTAHDPRTYRVRQIEIPAAIAETGGEVLARFLESAALQISRQWVRHYGVGLPHRTEWKVRTSQ